MNKEKKSSGLEALIFLSVLVLITSLAGFSIGRYSKSCPEQSPELSDGGFVVPNEQTTAIYERINTLENRIKVLEDEPDVKQYEVVKDIYHNTDVIIKRGEIVIYQNDISDEEKYNKYCFMADCKKYFDWCACSSLDKNCCCEEFNYNCISKKEIQSTEFFKPLK